MDKSEVTGREGGGGGRERWRCVCVWRWGLFFLLFREGLVEFEVWVGSSSLVSDWGWLCVSMTQLTSGSNMNRTRTRIRASGLTCVPRHKDMCVR